MKNAMPRYPHNKITKKIINFASIIEPTYG